MRVGLWKSLSCNQMHDGRSAGRQLKSFKQSNFECIIKYSRMQLHFQTINCGVVERLESKFRVTV